MIRHIVLIKFGPQISEADINLLWADLMAIKGKVPGLVEISAGKSQSPEQIERGYLHGFVAVFTDWTALQAYQDHPDHKRFGGSLVANAVGGIDGILVFDLST